MSKIQTIPVRVTEEFREKLQAEATATDRPIASLVRVLLQDALAKRSAPQEAS
ncbi:MAG TPA: hypothetical protein VIQ05_23205 [Tardiphaga sp.]